jgi:hypothetical protein
MDGCWAEKQRDGYYYRVADAGEDRVVEEKNK